MLASDLQLEKQEIKERIAALGEVIAWSKENGGLSVGQRICLHQERAGIFKIMAALEYGEPVMGIYRIPRHLEEKVQHIQKVIVNTQWEKQEIKY